MNPGDEILHYRIVRQLGAGGMGVVYEAVDTRLGRHVALKLLPDRLRWSAEIVERFEREARIASSLNHPNICTVYDIGIHEDRKFIVMELLEGETLRERMHGQPLPIDLVLDVGHQIADALDAAHAKGIVHRDVKPANILINRRGQAKLLDFGVAKLGTDVHAPAAETRASSEVLTTVGMAVGSINYMSPEQARGEELDARTDLFSLGLVLYEMVTGRQAFTGATTAVVFDAILNRPPIEPRQLNDIVPEDLQRVILRSLEKDRRLRFQTAADMVAELGRIRRDTGVRAGMTSGVTAAATPAAATTAAVPASIDSETHDPDRDPRARRRGGVRLVPLAAQRAAARARREGHGARRRLHEHDRRPRFRRRAEAGGGGAAPADTVPDVAARLARPAHAGADAAQPGRAGARPDRARGLPARRRQGDRRRIDRRARHELRPEPRRPQLRDGRAAGAAAGAGDVEGRGAEGRSAAP